VTLLNIATAILWAGLASNWFVGRAKRRHPCDCGRAVPGLFGRRHPVGWVMLADALATTVKVGAFVLGIVAIHLLGYLAVAIASGFVGAIYVLLAIFDWLRWWRHERDRLKRAAKALGRVIVDAHGRLRITTTPAVRPS